MFIARGETKAPRNFYMLENVKAEGITALQIKNPFAITKMRSADCKSEWQKEDIRMTNVKAV